MKSKWLPFTPSLAACLAGALAPHSLAQGEDQDLVLDRNRLMVAARFSFGVRMQVENLSVPPLPSGEYHDGFVRPDLSGSADGKTWYWGYQSDSQVAGDDLQMHQVIGSPSDGQSATSDNGLQAGFEVVYARELGRFNLGKRRVPWGVEVGISSLNSKLETQDQFAGTVSVVTDSFHLNGVVPPLAPYSGTYNGPGPLLDTSPYASNPATASASSDVHSTVDSLLVGLKLGPFLEIPITPKINFNFSAGLAGLGAFTDFKFQETALVPSYPDLALSRSGEISKDSFVLGAYAEATFSYALSDFLSLYAGGQYQYLGDIHVSTGGKEATLQFDQAFEAVVGLRTSF